MPETFGQFEQASLQINFGNMDFREAQRSMRLFCQDVMPQFLDAPAQAAE